MPAPEWAFVLPRHETACTPSLWAAAAMYDVDIDAAVPVQGEEYQGDIYQEETP
jgi:hypothetical protein